MEYYQQIQEASDYIKSRITEIPDLAIVLGTGLSRLVQEIDVIKKLSFSSIPHFPITTVPGHHGELIIGYLNKKLIIAQVGRLHYYEGYEMKQICFPIRVFQALGIKKLIMGSAVGGMGEKMEAGDVGVVSDHINLFPSNPLRGANDERLGPRYPEMTNAYSHRLISASKRIAHLNGFTLHDAIYAGLAGPNIETRAEYSYLDKIGASVVGMSTVPEIIVANHAGMESCVFVAITNCCPPSPTSSVISIEEILKNAAVAEKKIRKIVLSLLAEI